MLRMKEINTSDFFKQTEMDCAESVNEGMCHNRFLVEYAAENGNKSVCRSFSGRDF